MIKTILEVLNSNSNIYNYNVSETITDSYQLFFIKQDLDMNREAVVTKYNVTIYTLENDKIGEVSFKLFDSMDKQEIENKIKEQIKLCKYTANKMFTFPRKKETKPVTKDKTFDGYSLKDAAFIAADALFEADKYENGYINSSEIFINYEENHFYDKAGNNFVYTKVYGQIEFIVTFTSKVEEIELYKFIDFGTLDANYIQQEANKLFIEAGARSKAIPTPAIKNAKVMLTGDMVKEYFNAFANRARVESVYRNFTNYKEGMVIQDKEECDKLYISLVPTMKGSTKGRPYDEDGVVLKKTQIIENGVVKSLWGSNSISQYLDKNVVGNIQNIVAGAGSISEEDLKNEEYVELVSLSGFDIDPITGDFGSEIRLAYYYKDNTRVAITKGSVSGNVLDTLNEVRFAFEKKQQNDFEGPKFVLLPKASFMHGE